MAERSSCSTTGARRPIQRAKKNIGAYSYHYVLIHMLTAWNPQFFTITCIMVLLAFIIYLLMTHSPASKQAASRWGAHFTIPILSPFTSVVSYLLFPPATSVCHRGVGLLTSSITQIEHEVSTFGTTALIGFAFVFACLAYAVFRYYAGRRST